MEPPGEAEAEPRSATPREEAARWDEPPRCASPVVHEEERDGIRGDPAVGVGGRLVPHLEGAVVEAQGVGASASDPTSYVAVPARRVVSTQPAAIGATPSIEGGFLAGIGKRSWSARAMSPPWIRYSARRIPMPVRADGRAAVVAVRGRLVPEAPDAADHVLHRVLELDDQVGEPGSPRPESSSSLMPARAGGSSAHVPPPCGPARTAGHVDEVAERLEHVPARRGRDRDVDVRRGADELDHASGRCPERRREPVHRRDRGTLCRGTPPSGAEPRTTSGQAGSAGVRSDRPAVRSGVDTANTVRLG